MRSLQLPIRRRRPVTGSVPSTRFAPLRAVMTAEAVASSACRMRCFAEAQLAQWGLCVEDREAAALVVGELLANAAQHGRSRMTLRLALHPQFLHIAVADHGAAGTTPGAASSTAAVDPEEHGRGLAIVTALSAWVEIVDDATGREVWTALALTARGSADQGPEPARETAGAATGVITSKMS